jgi:hypothetical protein
MSELMKWMGLSFAGNWVIYACLAATTAGGGMLGWTLGRAPLQVQMARQTTAYTASQAAAAQLAAAILQGAQARGDALTVGLLNQQAQIDQLKTEKRNAIAKATTGKPCLNGTALRLLTNAPGLSVRDLSPATGGAAAAGEPVATDTDVAFWIVDAGAAFEVCRARLDALIDWTPSTPNPAKP